MTHDQQARYNAAIQLYVALHACPGQLSETEAGKAAQMRDCVRDANQMHSFFMALEPPKRTKSKVSTALPDTDTASTDQASTAEASTTTAAEPSNKPAWDCADDW